MVNIDKLLAYSTVRIVRIKDWRLGALHYTFLFGIFLYIVVYNLVLEKNYLDRESPIGTVRLQLQAPEAKYRTASPAYCGDNGTYVGDDGGKFPRYPCWYLDEYYVTYPTTEARAIFASSRVEQISQKVSPDNCSPPTHPGCGWTNSTVADPIFLIPDFEWFTLYIDHSMNAHRLGYTRNAIEMDGELKDHNGVDMNPCDLYAARGFSCPSYISMGQNGTTDIVPLKSLLDAAGISLDTLSTSTGGGGVRDNYSKRFAGLVLLMTISYDNTFSYNTNSFRYSYTIEEVANTQFKAEQPEYDPFLPSQRIINNRHGLRLVVQQAGSVGAFSFQVTLIQLVSSLGLLAVATVLVDVMATMILPRKDIYRSFKYEECAADMEDARINADPLHHISSARASLPT